MYFVSKEDVQKYPLINFNSCISVVDNKKEVLKCCNIISQSSVVGFDTETKPAFQKGIIHDVSLLQLSVADHVFLFRLNKIGFAQEIIDILSNKHILKVGIDIKNDISALKRLKSFEHANFIDLNTLAISNGFKSIGAVKLSIMLLGYRISKKQRLSDWSSEILTDSQINYAAIDAWICPKLLAVFKSRSLYP